MAKINQGRFTVDNSTELVVFLIGARVNSFWLLPISLPVLSRMRTMLLELAKDPELGLLGVQNFGLGGMVQYWKSHDHLMRYAESRQHAHKPAWVTYFKRLFKNVSAGIWHETFMVSAGNYESIYTNMPNFGMGRFRPLIAAEGNLATAEGRLARSAPSSSVAALSMPS